MHGTVISLGQCRPDQAAITHLLTRQFAVNVIALDTAEELEERLKECRPDLILINRKLDIDYSDGMDVLRTLKSNAATASVPVMLVSNFPEWQEKAVAVGALPGFGKAELALPQTVEKLRAVLLQQN